MAVAGPDQRRGWSAIESEHDRWEMVFGDPDPSLRPFVVHYCGYDEETTSFTRGLEAPSLKAPLIFNFGPPIPRVGVRAPAPNGSGNRRASSPGSTTPTPWSSRAAPRAASRST